MRQNRIKNARKTGVYIVINKNFEKIFYLILTIILGLNKKSIYDLITLSKNVR